MKETEMERKTIEEYEREITVAYLQDDNEKAHQLEEELYRAYPAHAVGDVPDRDSD